MELNLPIFLTLKSLDLRYKIKLQTETLKHWNKMRAKLLQGNSKRSMAEWLGIYESTLRKRLKVGIVPTSLGRQKLRKS